MHWRREGIMLTGMDRILHLVDQYPNRKLQTLMHLVNKTTLKEVHKKQETGKASGIDKVTKTTYEKNLDENLENLLAKMKTFSYRPQPVRRTYIEKEGKSELRPLGIPSYEDRLVQGVIAEILNTIYEPKFYDFSYGFREARDCHMAIKHLDKILMGKTSWVVDADIKNFFGNVNHEWMMKFLEHEIADKNLLRYIKRFLKAGIMEAGQFTETDSGVPQGGLCSPVMANVYLHYVLDMWFEIKVKKASRGMAEIVRYADDCVCCFQYEDDARNFYEALKERLAKFGLELSEDKSQIIKFGRFANEDAKTFDFLGFTIVSGKNRSGNYTVKYRTSEKKLKIKRIKVKMWLHQNMHTPIGELIKKLNVKLRGHYNYYGLSHNFKKMKGFYKYVERTLFKTLNRRGGKRKLNWDKYNKMLEHLPILEPKITVPLWQV
jgi:group II intron reverse transcriptase/maturase